MFQKPVAIQITRGALEAIASLHPIWKTPDTAWEAFRKWTLTRGQEVALACEDKPPYLHELLDLYEFGHQSSPRETLDGFLRLCGRSFANNLLRERLPDLLR